MGGRNSSSTIIYSDRDLFHGEYSKFVMLLGKGITIVYVIWLGITEVATVNILDASSEFFILLIQAKIDDFRDYEL